MVRVKNSGQVWTTLLGGVFFLVLTTAAAAAQEGLGVLGAARLAPHKVEVVQAEYNGHAALKVQGPNGAPVADEDTYVLIDDLTFENGEITVELAGAPNDQAPPQARGFVGLAFHVDSQSGDFEAIYLRPTNARADHQLRRNHSVQYISYPEYPWQRLREEAPGLYETYVDLTPGAWTSYRLVVEGATARLFVDGAAEPTLIVNDLKHAGGSGKIALWIGNGTVAYFRNLQVKPAP